MTSPDPEVTALVAAIEARPWGDHAPEAEHLIAEARARGLVGMYVVRGVGA